jgi:hypothetical protein
VFLGLTKPLVPGEIAQADDFDRRRPEDRAQLRDFMRVARGEHDRVHGRRLAEEHTGGLPVVPGR